MTKTCLSSGESCRSVADWRSASSSFGSARAFSFASFFFFFSASTRVCSISFCSSSLTNFWLSVSFGSRFFGWTSVSCVIAPLSSGTRKRLFSRVKVTAASRRGQREAVGRFLCGGGPGEVGGSGGGHEQDEDAAQACGKRHEKVYNS